MPKEIENLEFVRGVNFEFIDSIKNSGTKNLLIFDNSCEEICSSKAFGYIVTARRHRGLSTIYIRHTFFTRGNWEETLSYKTFTLFSLNPPVT